MEDHEMKRSEHPDLSEMDVIKRGGWHPRYARVLAVATHEDNALSLVDGNGDEAELDLQIWAWDGDTWVGTASYGVGNGGSLGSCRTGRVWRDTYYAYGKTSTPDAVADIDFAGRRYTVPGGRFGFWAFIRTVDEDEVANLDSPCRA
jgi:hypothetical protein